ncbi:hypothetical protein FE257_006597 [Aspergillus nanangensis]|uniref:Zn(2)-C6 fungal-type domain-containing protein n=1 Tax=Aspergillus nanangensis TaxID=2582783 RepID=A0AAD4CZQ3_ASPNN|nr:hypothetical protein FE257_006597 [Aspergillus nanangensis]
MSGRHRSQRTEVACAECRRRKLKCEGTRPTCSRCETIGQECHYHSPSNTQKRRGRPQSDPQDLLRRIEELESQLSLLKENQRHECGDSCKIRNPLQLGNCYGSSLSEQKSQSTSGRIIDVETETSVDELATHALTETSEGDIGYFGPSSNYSIFRLLSKLFMESALRRCQITTTSTEDYNISHEQGMLKRVPDNSPRDSNRSTESTHALPTGEEGLYLIQRFSTTIGVILPYVNPEQLSDAYQKASRGNSPRFRRTLLILLNMVWAHASASLQRPEAETFYQRAMELSDNQTIERPSFELAQALLLMSIYEQNHQRSILSYTTHAMCVKASMQIGLHSTSVRESYGHELGRLRQRIWAGVSNNDRILGLTQGRPFLIPVAKICLNQAFESSGSVSSLLLSHLTASTSLLAEAIHQLYDNNLDTGQSPDMQELIRDRSQLKWRLEQWADNLTFFGGVASSHELSDQSINLDTRQAARVLLSIQYHRLGLTINFPLVSRFLQFMTNHSYVGKRTLGQIQQAGLQVMRDDWHAVQELNRLISLVSTHASFLDMYSAWYTCNYTVFTVVLHCLTLFLIHQQDPTVGLGIEPSQMRQEIDASLLIMREIRRGSVINRKAEYCIQRLLVVFDALENQPPDRSDLALDPVTAEFLLQHIKRPTLEFLTQYSLFEGSDQNQSFLDLYSKIPLCE